MPEITETKLKEQIAKEQIGSLYFLYGDEKLLVRRNLNRLLKKLDGNFPEYNFQEFPHDAPVDSIADAVVAMPFMAERKCVTVSDLNVEAMNTAELDKLYELLDTIPETTVLILYLPTLEIDPKKSAKWRTFLKKLDTRGFSLPSLRLKDNELEKYVCREAEKANCLLSRKLAERIVQYVGNDLNALTNEVTKLCAFAGGGEITAEQVEKTVTKNMETTVFLLSNALVRGDYSKAYALLDLLYLPTLEIDPKKSAKWRTFLKKLDTRGFSLPSLRLKDNELEKYVCREAEKANCLLSRKLAERIVQYVGNDLNALTNEVTKLCAFAGGGEITAEQVEKTVTKNMETTVFLLSNALVRGDYSKAYALLDLLMAQREEPYTILAVLSSAYIDMYRVRAAIEAGKTSMAPTEYSDYRGRDFRLKYAERDVRDLSIEMLRECLSLLLNCDLSIKLSGGENMDRIALEKLFAQLLYVAHRGSVA